MKRSVCLLAGLFFLSHFLYCQETVSRDSVSGKKYSELPYRSGDTLSAYQQERCKLDIYVPAKTISTKPVLIYFHGGGLTSGDKSEGWADWSNNFGYRFLNAGVITVMVNYRLSGKNNSKWPDYLQDAAAAVLWVHQHIAEYGGDPANLFVSGFSAGAYITHMLSIDNRWLQEAGMDRKNIRGYIPMSGQTRQHGTVAADLGVAEAELMTLKPFAMPLALVKKTDTPVYIFVGEKEGQTIKDNKTYYDELVKKDSPGIFFHIQAGKDHGGMRDGLGDADSPVRARIIDFIQKYSVNK